MHSVWKTSIRFTLITVVRTGPRLSAIDHRDRGSSFSSPGNGSLILQDGHVIGSSLLAQSFTSDRYYPRDVGRRQRL